MFKEYKKKISTVTTVPSVYNTSEFNKSFSIFLSDLLTIIVINILKSFRPLIMLIFFIIIANRALAFSKVRDKEYIIYSSTIWFTWFIDCGAVV